MVSGDTPREQAGSGGGAACDEAIAEMCRLLSDPQRVRILRILASSGPGVCVCDLALELGRSQPTASYHLKKLGEVGFLDRESSGKLAYYRPTAAALEALSGLTRLASAYTAAGQRKVLHAR